MCTQQLLSKTAYPATIDCEIDATGQQGRCSDILCQIQKRGDHRRHRQELMGNLYE